MCILSFGDDCVSYFVIQDEESDQGSGADDKSFGFKPLKKKTSITISPVAAPARPVQVFVCSVQVIVWEFLI